MNERTYPLDPKGFEERKLQEVVRGHRILGRAASGKSLEGHGTGDFRYEQICEEGAVIHRKGDIQYANLGNFLGGEAPWDQGNGLFVLDPERTRALAQDELFILQPDGSKKVFLTNMKWIILPPCEAEIARGPRHDRTAVARYREKIVTYEEAAQQLGYVEGLNRVTAETQRCIDTFRSRLGASLQGREAIAQAIDRARALVLEAAQEGANGVVKAGMALQLLMQALPDAHRVIRRANQLHLRPVTRIEPGDKSWYAVVQMIDAASQDYALVLRDNRMVDRRVWIDASRMGRDSDGLPVFE